MDGHWREDCQRDLMGGPETPRADGLEPDRQRVEAPGRLDNLLPVLPVLLTTVMTWAEAFG